MGSYNMTCNLTGVSVLEDEEIIGIPIIIGINNHSRGRVGDLEIDATWKPLGIVLYGGYSSYGYIENVRCDQSIEDFKKIYDTNNCSRKIEDWNDFAVNMERSLVTDAFKIQRKEGIEVTFEDLTDKEKKEIEKEFGCLSLKELFTDESKKMLNMQIRWSETASNAREYGESEEYIVGQMLIQKGFVDYLKKKIPEEFVKGYTKCFCRQNPQLSMVVAKMGINIDLEYILYFMSKTKTVITPSMYGSQTSWEAMDMAKAEYIIEHHKRVFEKQKSEGHYFEGCEEEDREPTLEDYLKIRKDWWMKDEF